MRFLTAEHPISWREWSIHANAFSYANWGPGETSRLMCTRWIDYGLRGPDWWALRCWLGCLTSGPPIALCWPTCPE